MRALILNQACPDSCLGDYEVLHLDGAFTCVNELRSVTPVNLQDVDLVVADLEKIPIRDSSSGSPASLNGPIADFVEGGGLLVCFSSVRADTRWIPGVPATRDKISGDRVRIDHEDDFKEVLTTFVGELSYDCTFEKPRENDFRILASTLAGFPVGLSARNRRVLLFPRVKRVAPFMTLFLTNLVPLIIPGRISRVVSEPGEERPDWLSLVEVPGLDILNAEIEQLKSKLKNIENLVHEKEVERASLQSFDGLLWLKGKRDLEPLVRRALTMLGVPVHEQPPIDAVYVDDLLTLYIEIEGSDNSIGIDKGRQLMDYIMQTDDPASIMGAIVGNPLRKIRPEERRSYGRPLFSPELTRLSERQNWKLLDTPTLFNLVVRHLSGEDVSLELRSLLGLSTG